MAQSPIMVHDPNGQPLIEVTFIQDEIFELNEAGQHREERDQSRILMSIRNISGGRMEINGQQGPVDQNIDGFARCTSTPKFTSDGLHVTSTVHFRMTNIIHIKIVYNFAPGSRIVRFDIDDGCHGVNQMQGACAFSQERVITNTCLQLNAFLWEGNNYRCYRIQKYKEEHVTQQIWFCKPCAKPGMLGMRQQCPLHDEYDNALNEDLIPVPATTN